MKALIAFFLFLNLFWQSPDQNRRITKLEESLMAPCCYSQNIREHMSFEAAQMRDEVSQMVLAGKSDREILNYYKAKYGETILVVPDGVAGGLTFGIPVAATLLATGILIGLAVYRTRRGPAPVVAAQVQGHEAIPPEILERIRRESNGGI